MVSYAQNYEDLVLSRVFADRPSGFYVDVGAAEPDRNSVTHHFSLAGWRGINIEPGPLFDRFASVRPRDINLQCAVGATAGTAELKFFPQAPGLSTLADPTGTTRERGGEMVVLRVPIRPLADILTEHAPDTIDFLTIDVEGTESAVLRSNDWDRFRPIVVVAEATEPLTNRPSFAEWDPILTAVGYRFTYFDGLNRFYVRDDHADRLRDRFVPPNVLDEVTRWDVALLRDAVDELEQANNEPNRISRLLDRDIFDAALRIRTAARQYRTVRDYYEGLTRGLGDRSLRWSLGVARRIHAVVHWCRHPFGRRASRV